MGQGLVRILTWSPFGNRPWYFHLFNSLWVWATVVVLMLSLPSWLGQAVSFPSQLPDDSQAEVDLFDYSSPLPLKNGKCMIIETREMVEC